MISLKFFENVGSYCFFIDLHTNGCFVPFEFNRNFFFVKKYRVFRQDVYTCVFWQKPEKFFFSNKDEGLTQKFKKKYPLL